MRRPIKEALRPEVKALPSSGPLSMSDIQGEFDGSNPISLSEYYGAAPGVPSSGTISIGDFYGKSSERVLSNLGDYQTFAAKTQSAPTWISSTGRTIDASANWQAWETKLDWNVYNNSTGQLAQMKSIYATYTLYNLFNSPALSAADAGKRLRIKCSGKWYRDNNVGGNECPMYFQNQSNQTQKSVTINNDTPSNLGSWTGSFTLSASNNGSVTCRLYANGGNGTWRSGNLRMDFSRNGNDWILGG